MFAELRSKERGGSRTSALIYTERGASAQPLLGELKEEQLSSPESLSEKFLCQDWDRHH